MEIFEQTSTLQAYLKAQRQAGKRVGLVPTMGALHAGHLSLIEAARQTNDVVVASIFVNPIQFNNPQDLAVYPRTLAADSRLLQEAGCSAVFAPSEAEMYPQPTQLRFDFGNLERVLEGTYRPGHFNGVGVVVSKLFHMVQPDTAYFGQKDLQQCLVIRRLVRDLSFALDLYICPTVREADGLAMSSRNRNLSPEHRKQAAFIHQNLQQAQAALLGGDTPETIRQRVKRAFDEHEAFDLEYFAVVETETLTDVQDLSGLPEVAFCVAAYLGGTRLIDNLIVALPHV